MNERGFIPVDEFMRTNLPGVYAIGDVIPTPQLAHVASAEAIVAAEHMAGAPTRPIDYRTTPSCTYSTPEVASVGLTEKAAREATGDLRRYSLGEADYRRHLLARSVERTGPPRIDFVRVDNRSSVSDEVAAPLKTVKNRLPSPAARPALSTTPHAIVWTPLASVRVSNW